LSAASDQSEIVLQLESVSRRFGGVIAVDDLDMSIRRGTIHGLIGPNGSGKSTTFNLISGEIPVSTGRIFFKGKEITGLHSYQMAGLGIARTFQAADLFPEFTVRENLAVASSSRSAGGFWDVLLCSASYRRSQREIERWAGAILERLGLSDVADLLVRELPHRHQKAMAFANALATDPDLVMLDEPAAGLTHQEMEEMSAFYRSLRDEGRTILLVEHNMRTVMSLCSRITVLNQGMKIAEGSPSEIAANPVVIEAYLGKQGHGRTSLDNVTETIHQAIR
jgi:branched-chain amino acid transport system ATP-binding protein